MLTEITSLKVHGLAVIGKIGQIISQLGFVHIGRTRKRRRSHYEAIMQLAISEK